jgi:hypothetical protein
MQFFSIRPLLTTADICFGNSIDAIDAPAHEAPIVTAMDASLSAFNAFKHSYMYKNMIINCPPNISRAISPLTAGLVDLQEVKILAVVTDKDSLCADPQRPDPAGHAESGRT